MREPHKVGDTREAWCRICRSSYRESFDYCRNHGIVPDWQRDFTGWYSDHNCITRLADRVEDLERRLNVNA
jgi:hypothetical protein